MKRYPQKQGFLTDGYTPEGIDSPTPSNHYLLIDPQGGLGPHRVQILKTSHGVALWSESDHEQAALEERSLLAGDGTGRSPF